MNDYHIPNIFILEQNYHLIFLLVKCLLLSLTMGFVLCQIEIFDGKLIGLFTNLLSLGQMFKSGPDSDFNLLYRWWVDKKKYRKHVTLFIIEINRYRYTSPDISNLFQERWLVIKQLELNLVVTRLNYK